MKLPAVYDDLSPRERRRAREQYILQQKGLCQYCQSPLLGPAPDWVQEKRVTPRLYPPGFFDNPVHLHHSHEDGLTIGAVHAYCNAVLWEHHDE